MNFTDRHNSYKLIFFLRNLGIKSAARFPRSPLRVFTLSPLQVKTNE